MSSEEKGQYVDSYEDVSMFALAAPAEAEMLAKQTECVFMWTTAEHEPVGVIMSFVHRDGHFWLTATRRRKRIRAITARPRVAVAVSSRGTDIGVSRCVTYKGTAVLHDDEATKRWYYPALAAKLRPGGEFRFSTDHPVYLRHALMMMRRFRAEFDWLCETPSDFLVRPGGWPETRYEAKARAQGHEVWYFRWRRTEG